MSAIAGWEQRSCIPRLIAMLEVEGLTKRYHRVAAVENVSFSIRPGEILGCLGPNGAGKSTTVKVLIGLLEPSEGRVLMDGRSVIEDLQAFQRRLGYVPEEPNLYPHLSGREYLQLAGRLRGISRAALEAKIEGFLRLFSLWGDRDAGGSGIEGLASRLLESFRDVVFTGAKGDPRRERLLRQKLGRLRPERAG